MSAHNEQVAGDRKVVAIYFTLKNDQGVVLESNRNGGKPLVYLHGQKSIVPGLEQAITGKKKNDFFSVSLPPEQGWGARRADLIEKVRRSNLPAELNPSVGARLQGVDPQGRPILAIVTAVEGDEITIDKNHPFAGHTLNYEVLIAGVRDATPEELAHGHVHGVGGHKH